MSREEKKRELEETHKMLKEMLESKIKDSENNPDEKLTFLFEQIGNPKKSFFESISPAIAKTVLLDIGVDEKEWMDVYVKLMKEEQQRKYILIDLGNDI